MVSERGSDSQLLARLHHVVLELEGQSSSDSESPATVFMDRATAAIRAGDFEALGHLVSDMESELQLTAEKPESTSREPVFEEGDLGIPPPRRKGSAWSWPAGAKARISKAGQALRRLMPTQPTRTRLLTSAVLGLLFALLLGLAANWRLLWGVDTPGIYTSQDFFYRPGVDVALPSVLSALDGANPYATQYLTLGIEGIVAAYCIQLLTGALARGTFSGVGIVAAETLAAAFYLTNPFILTFGTTSLLSNVLVSNSAFIAFLAILIKLLGDVRNGRPIARSTALFMGLTIGLSNPYAFPNLLRIQMMIVAALALGFLYLLVVCFRSTAPPEANRHPLRTTVLRFCAFTVPPALALVAYPIWSAWSTYIAPGGSLGAIISSQPALALSTFNTFPFVIRLLGKGTFHHFAYATLFSGTSVESVASWAWPMLALGVPAVAVLARRPRFLSWKQVAVAEVLGWLAIAWSEGSNAPFGFAVGPVIRAYPRLQYAFPYYYPEYQILSVLYPVLASVSLIWLGLGTRDLLHWLLSGRGATANGQVAPANRSTVPMVKRPRGLNLASIGSKLVVLCLSCLLLLVALPVYDGQTLTSNASLAPGGFEIPKEYSALRAVLQSLGGNTLLLPGVQSYVQTSWGYYGASSFYTIYNYPSQVIQPAYYGPFQILNPVISRSYQNLTEPLVPGGLTTYANSSFKPPIQLNNFAGALTIRWPTKAAYDNFSGSAWIGLTLSSFNPSLLLQEIGEGNVSAGLASINSSGVPQVSWFPMERTFNSQETNLSGGGVQFVILPSLPSKGVVNLSKVTGVEVRVKGLSDASQLGLSLVGVELWSSSGLAPSWSNSLESADVTNLLTDSTLVGGLQAPEAYANFCLSPLLSTGKVTLIWESSDLHLYRLQAA